MNKEVARINERELQIGGQGSWHDQYKDSAYVYVGGLPYDLTEGDVITIMSQYGEVMDVNMPRDKSTGKTKGFAFLMYQDQRSTILAVDNLNGAKVLERTLKVDHVGSYKQPKDKNDEGELVERTEQSLNARPELVYDGGHASSSEDDEPLPDIDPDDPMRDYLIQKHREAVAERKKKKGAKRANETPEERAERKRRKKDKKEKKAKKLAIEPAGRSTRPRSRSPDRRDARRERSRSPRARDQQRAHDRYRDDDDDRRRRSPQRRRSRSR